MMLEPRYLKIYYVVLSREYQVWYTTKITKSADFKWVRQVTATQLIGTAAASASPLKVHSLKKRMHPPY